MTDYNVFHHLAYDWVIVADFFLGGLAAGALIISWLLYFRSAKYKMVGRILGILSPLIMMLGMLMLLLHLGKPFRFYFLFFNFHSSSMISWGNIFLNLFVGTSLIYAFFLYLKKDGLAKLFGILATPLAVAVAGYTAFLLNQMPSNPLLNIWFVLSLFLLGGLVSGQALAVLVAIGTGEEDVSGLAGVLVKLLIALIILVAVYIFSLFGTPQAKLLLFGPLTFLFLIVQLGAGTLFPLRVFLKQSGPKTQAIAAALVLVGIYVMRYVIVIGSQIL